MMSVNRFPEPRRVMTEDGSHTIYLPEINEHYHSIHGAIQESRHIFINAGWKMAITAKEPVNILEVGFGTGLNALLTCLESAKLKIKVNYIGLEPYPPDNDLLQTFNYTDRIQEPEARDYYEQMLQEVWGNSGLIHPWFSLTKQKIPIQEYSLQNEEFHLIYYDAFSPEAQPAMWTGDVFKKLADGLYPGGIMVTYSCKGDVKRVIRASGLITEKLPGPPGKREMLRAIKPRK